MNKILTIAAKIVYLICQVSAFAIVEIMAAVYMKIYNSKN